MQKLKKILITMLIAIFDTILLCNVVCAANLTEAHLYTTEECPTLLRYKGIDVKVTYVQYDNNGIQFPAYCLDKNLDGVTEDNPYSVSIQDAINDVILWRRVINGYPYKSLEELGVATKEEAFTATKQAIYCYIHGNKLEDYEPVGEAGERTLNAMYKIVTSAESSTETKIANTVTIQNHSKEWLQDTEKSEYVYKTYSIKANANIQNYKVKLEKITEELPKGYLIVDENNNEKNEFAYNEKFKILIPIKEMEKENNFKIKIETLMETKPVLYGKAPSSDLQDYAITLASYENATGKTEDKYPKNETKIIIQKIDEETKEKLSGVSFNILNDKEEVIYSDLKTNENGEIEIKNLLPGDYIIQEISSLENYEVYKEKINLNIKLHQTATVIVNNRKGKEPQTNITKTSQSTEVKRLPVTGF